jgi:hypothetical protein
MRVKDSGKGQYHRKMGLMPRRILDRLTERAKKDIF